ncbi:hypothetical protein NPIL_385561 [Nephila pilipes]|uniref:Uncharacterized protein n=1 Tax=Nephila pilipes TaxID=299642 RepID=A0A8X6PH62_NEPPI|nr:hypothetical protein NPIL_385561 [Nephila pilipes]
MTKSPSVLLDSNSRINDNNRFTFLPEQPSFTITRTITCLLKEAIMICIISRGEISARTTIDEDVIPACSGVTWSKVGSGKHPLIVFAGAPK